MVKRFRQYKNDPLMNMPTVSFIMPAYNVENYIAKSIESVLAQTFDSWELIIVNDGSPDNSREVALSYIAKDPRILLYDKANGGLSDARNYGLERARGDYVVFLDSDDWIEPDVIALLLADIIAQDIDVVVFSFITDYLDAKGQVKKQNQTTISDRMLYRSQLDSLNDAGLGLLYFAWNKLYKRLFLLQNNIKFQKGLRLIEDCEFNSRVFPLVRKVHFCSNCLNHYVVRNENTLSKMFNKDLFELQKRSILCRIEMFYKLGLKEQRINELVVMYCFTSVKYILFCLINFADDLSFRNKVAYLKIVLNDSSFNEALWKIKGEGLIERVRIFMLKNKLSFIVMATHQLLSLLKKRE